jgi:WD repeat-containing protein 7
MKHSRSLKLLRRWVVFLTPLTAAVILDENFTGRLKGCVLCISEDGSIAVLATEDLEL